MDVKSIKQIVELMKDNDLSEFELEEEGLRIAVKRRGLGEPQIVVSQPVQAAAPAAAPAAEAPAPKAKPDNIDEVKSPIVGTFYRSSSPDTEPFVTVGQHVEPDTVVCIVEAMKVMNEIKAEVSGTIRRVCVENATPVQFDQPLFEVERA